MRVDACEATELADSLLIAFLFRERLDPGIEQHDGIHQPRDLVQVLGECDLVHLVVELLPLQPVHVILCPSVPLAVLPVPSEEEGLDVLLRPLQLILPVVTHPYVIPVRLILLAQGDDFGIGAPVDGPCQGPRIPGISLHPVARHRLVDARRSHDMASDAGLLKTPLEAEAGWASLVPDLNRHGDAHLLPQPVHIGDNALGGRNCGAFCDKQSGLRVEGAQRIRILMDIDADRSYNFIAIHEVISFACGKARLFGLDNGIAESTTLQIRGHFILFIMVGNMIVDTIQKGGNK